MTPEDFIEFLKPAFPYVKSRGYFPSVFAGQASLETGWGKTLPIVGFNMFGHKWNAGEPWAYYIKETPEQRGDTMNIEQHRFRVYPNLDAAVKAYCDKWEEVYEQSGEPKYPDQDFSSPQAFIESVAVNYCTDQKYADKIIALIEEWSLEQYDDPNLYSKGE